jgi:signal transduction histidine kinase
MVAAREEDQGGLLLANLPAILEAEAPTRLPKGMTPVRLTLAGAWLAILASLLTAGISLRGSLALSEKRSRFASAITHELRTPLTTFRMYSEMLLLDMVKDPEQRRDYLETLTRESARLSRLVENVLSWSGVEEGRLTPRASRVGVNGLLSGIAPVLRSRADTFGMEIAIDMDTEAGEVEVDPDTISQILFNLVDNGCKYAGPSGGPLTLTTKTEPGAVTIEVRDHGPGIPGNERHHLFSPFERAGRDGTDGIPGLGLGLALSRGLARSQGGDLTHEPPPGGGSRFVLRLPVKKANVQ